MDKESLAKAIRGRRGQGIDLKIIIAPQDEAMEEASEMSPQMQEMQQDKSDLAPEVMDAQQGHPDAAQDIELVKQVLAERPETGNSFQSRVMQKRDARLKK